MPELSQLLNVGPPSVPSMWDGARSSSSSTPSTRSGEDFHDIADRLRDADQPGSARAERSRDVARRADHPERDRFDTPVRRDVAERATRSDRPDAAPRRPVDRPESRSPGNERAEPITGRDRADVEASRSEDPTADADLSPVGEDAVAVSGDDQEATPLQDTEDQAGEASTPDPATLLAVPSPVALPAMTTNTAGASAAAPTTSVESVAGVAAAPVALTADPQMASAPAPVEATPHPAAEGTSGSASVASTPATVAPVVESANATVIESVVAPVVDAAGPVVAGPGTPAADQVPLAVLTPVEAEVVAAVDPNLTASDVPETASSAAAAPERDAKAIAVATTSSVTQQVNTGAAALVAGVTGMTRTGTSDATPATTTGITATAPTPTASGPSAAGSQPTTVIAATAPATARPDAVVAQAVSTATPAPEHVEDNSARILGVARLLQRGDGAPSSMTLHLQPAHLGRVRVELSSIDGDLTVHLTADHRSGVDMISAALPSLRSSLEGEGIRVSDVSVAAGGAGSDDAGLGARRGSSDLNDQGRQANSSSLAPGDRGADNSNPTTTTPRMASRPIDLADGAVDLDL